MNEGGSIGGSAKHFEHGAEVRYYAKRDLEIMLMDFIRGTCRDESEYH